MKHLILVLIVSFQMTISPAALAWSPLDGLESAAESMLQCYSIVAGSEADQEDNKDEEEEEEPDCD